MSDDPLPDLDLRTASAEGIAERMAIGIRRALLEHKRAGNSVVVWDRENDRILTIPPEQFPVDDEPEADARAIQSSPKTDR